MEPYLNKKYVLVSSKHFEDYLTYIGVGYFAKKIALNLKPVQCLTLNEDGTHTFDFVSPITSSSVTFKSGEEFDEVKPDGVKVKSTITLDGNKMTHIQVEGNGRISKHVREFFHDKLIVTTTAPGLDKTVIREFKLME
ncbi:hypothetical protein O3G_MSEX009683 [Manduca sexta]|uniref:Cytosolic fatty-acid binding proteins domain-containing protein n=1 Tax=Manduca sexta TaxID=7130 RepID=A0A921ZFB0_MANSE|nr:hypothetical protein O3G_MSEX009683 [Manduca sexta]